MPSANGKGTKSASVSDVGAFVLSRLPSTARTSGDAPEVVRMDGLQIAGWSFVATVSAGIFLHILFSNPHKRS